MLKRRDLVKCLAGAGASAAIGRKLAFAQAVTLPAKPAAPSSSSSSTADKNSAVYAPVAAVKNRAPLTPNAFYLLPLGSVRPAGWLRQQLQIQAAGLGGHLDETWPDVGPNSGWLGGTGESWERGPYFLDGLLPLAYLLDDERLKGKAQKFIDWTLTHQAADGLIGPSTNNDWWPRMVMLKALTQYAEVTGDPRVAPCLSRYFSYQLKWLPTRPLRDWGRFRWQDNALSVLWLYNRTGDPHLLELVRLLHAQGFDWQANFANFTFQKPVTRESIHLAENGLSEVALASHGVNNGQAFKAAPVWSVVTGQEKDRLGLAQMTSALDTYHGLPNGMFSCDEHLAGRSPSQGSELCTVVETMFSLEQSLAILGEAALGDRLERIAFNALPGTFTDDMWAHQYNQEPNQVEVSLHNKPWTTDGPESNLYGLEPNFGCCAANFHQGWPKFAASLWMASDDGGLVAALYSPCEVHTVVSGVPVHVVETTEYPFRETVRITVDPATPLRFPLRLRVPAWTTGVTVHVNGQAAQAFSVAGYITIHRTWKTADLVEIRFPMTPRLATGFENSVSIERGPLVFSYPIGESWVKLRNRGLTADWQVFPSSAWNYALAVDAATAHTLEVTEHPVGPVPFSLAESAVRIQVTSRKLPAWRAVDGVADPVPHSSVSSNEPEETLTLVPYAAAKLRITAFPRLST